MTFNPMDPYAGVQTCANHPGPDFASDCTGCLDEYEERAKDLGKQKHEGDLITERLDKVGMKMPREAVLEIRMETLVDVMFRDRDRMMYEAECGTRVVKQLLDADKQVAKHTDLLIPKQSKVVSPIHREGR